MMLSESAWSRYSPERAGKEAALADEAVSTGSGTGVQIVIWRLGINLARFLYQ